MMPKIGEMSKPNWIYPIVEVTRNLQFAIARMQPSGVENGKKLGKRKYPNSIERDFALAAIIIHARSSSLYRKIGGILLRPARQIPAMAWNQES